MKKYFLHLIIGITAFIFTGCMQTPNVNFNAQMNRDIKTIAIVPPKNIKEINIFYYNHPGMSFGLAGGLIAAAEFSSKTSTYNKLIQSAKFDVNKYFLSKLAYYLKKEKYKVKLLPVDPKRDNKYLKQYPEVDANAYLDILLLEVGYIAGGPSAKYKPTVKISARLVKKSDKSIVYDKYLATGENFALAEEVDYIETDMQDSYEDFESLKKNAHKSVNGLKKALDKVAKRLALALKRR
jgi:hypothetical protein